MREIMIGIRFTLVLWILTALIYPFIMIGIGQVLLPYQANGSILTNAQGNPVGSALIGQTFTANNYFWSRPSTTNYSEGEEVKQTGVSGASNLAPSNPDLTKRITETINTLKQKGVQPTADLVYTSGSSLDPHINPETAQVQIQRVAQARAISIEQIQQLIQQNTEGRFLGLFGEPGVNVLKLNLALDALASKQ